MFRLFITLLKKNNNNSNKSHLKELKSYTQKLLQDDKIEKPKMSQDILKELKYEH